MATMSKSVHLTPAWCDGGKPCYTTIMREGNEKIAMKRVDAAARTYARREGARAQYAKPRGEYFIIHPTRGLIERLRIEGG